MSSADLNDSDIDVSSNSSSELSFNADSSSSGRRSKNTSHDKTRSHTKDGGGDEEEAARDDFFDLDDAARSRGVSMQPGGGVLGVTPNNKKRESQSKSSLGFLAELEQRNADVFQVVEALAARKKQQHDDATNATATPMTNALMMEQLRFELDGASTAKTDHSRTMPSSVTTRDRGMSVSKADRTVRGLVFGGDDPLADLILTDDDDGDDFFGEKKALGLRRGRRVSEFSPSSRPSRAQSQASGGGGVGGADSISNTSGGDLMHDVLNDIYGGSSSEDDAATISGDGAGGNVSRKLSSTMPTNHRGTLAAPAGGKTVFGGGMLTALLVRNPELVQIGDDSRSRGGSAAPPGTAPACNLMSAPTTATGHDLTNQKTIHLAGTASADALLDEVNASNTATAASLLHTNNDAIGRGRTISLFHSTFAQTQQALDSTAAASPSRKQRSGSNASSQPNTRTSRQHSLHAHDDIDDDERRGGAAGFLDRSFGESGSMYSGASGSVFCVSPARLRLQKLAVDLESVEMDEATMRILLHGRFQLILRAFAAKFVILYDENEARAALKIATVSSVAQAKAMAACVAAAQRGELDEDDVRVTIEELSQAPQTGAAVPPTSSSLPIPDELDFLADVPSPTKTTPNATSTSHLRDASADSSKPRGVSMIQLPSTATDSATAATSSTSGAATGVIQLRKRAASVAASSTSASTAEQQVRAVFLIKERALQDAEASERQQLAHEALGTFFHVLHLLALTERERVVRRDELLRPILAAHRGILVHYRRQLKLLMEEEILRAVVDERRCVAWNKMHGLHKTASDEATRLVLEARLAHQQRMQSIIARSTSGSTLISTTGPPPLSGSSAGVKAPQRPGSRKGSAFSSRFAGAHGGNDAAPWAAQGAAASGTIVQSTTTTAHRGGPVPHPPATGKRTTATSPTVMSGAVGVQLPPRAPPGTAPHAATARGSSGASGPGVKPRTARYLRATAASQAHKRNKKEEKRNASSSPRASTSPARSGRKEEEAQPPLEPFHCADYAKERRFVERRAESTERFERMSQTQRWRHVEDQLRAIDSAFTVRTMFDKSGNRRRPVTSVRSPRPSFNASTIVDRHADGLVVDPLETTPRLAERVIGITTALGSKRKLPDLLGQLGNTASILGATLTATTLMKSSGRRAGGASSMSVNKDMNANSTIKGKTTRTKEMKTQEGDVSTMPTWSESFPEKKSPHHDNDSHSDASEQGVEGGKRRKSTRSEDGHGDESDERTQPHRRGQPQEHPRRSSSAASSVDSKHSSRGASSDRTATPPNGKSSPQKRVHVGKTGKKSKSVSSSSSSSSRSSSASSSRASSASR